MTELHYTLLALGAALILVALALLGILFLRLGRKVARFLLVAGGLVAVIAVAHAMAEQARATRQAAQAATMAMATSAATTIIIFLLTVIISSVLAATGAAVGWHWWKQRQKRTRLWEMREQAEIYAVMQGQRLPSRPGAHRVAPGQPNIIVLQQPAQDYQVLPRERWEVVE